VTFEFTAAYTLTANGWHVLRALIGGPLPREDIGHLAGLGRAALTRELSSLEVADYIDRLTTGRYRLTDEGHLRCARPCPGVEKKRPTAPEARTTAPLIGALLPGERIALEQIAAHEGKSIAEIAAAVGRCAGNFQGQINALSVRCMITMPKPGGVKRIPRLTDEGRARLARKEAASCLVPFVPPVTTPATRSALHVEIPPADVPPVPVSFTGCDAKPGYRGIRHPSLESFGFKPGARASASIAGWS
jgi:hypothetical protein